MRDPCANIHQKDMETLPNYNAWVFLPLNLFRKAWFSPKSSAIELLFFYDYTFP